MEQRAQHRGWRKLAESYKTLAVLLLNTLMLIGLVALGQSIYSMVKDNFEPDPVTARYGDVKVHSIYQGRTKEEIGDLLQETWSRSYVYEPFMQFRERPYAGTYVNVSEQGFRYTRGQGKWPPEAKRINLFLFGGSTAFGYGVADDETLASSLQGYLERNFNSDIRVYNFGRGHYYSTQERILLESLLAVGIVPDLAVFVDGLNDFYYYEDEPFFTSQFRLFVDQEEARRTSNESARWKTIVSDYIAELWGSRHKDQVEVTNRLYNDPQILGTVISRYLSNKKLIEAISTAYGVETLFVWQPVPTYKYDQRYHPFSEGGYGKHTYSRYGYAEMAGNRERGVFGGNFLWCADMQQGVEEPLYVDKVHYTSRFTERFAHEIGREIATRYESLARNH